jgi:hypothetical protein
MFHSKSVPFESEQFLNLNYFFIKIFKSEIWTIFNWNNFKFEQFQIKKIQIWTIFEFKLLLFEKTNLNYFWTGERERVCAKKRHNGLERKEATTTEQLHGPAHKGFASGVAHVTDAESAE